MRCAVRLQNWTDPWVRPNVPFSTSKMTVRLKFASDAVNGSAGFNPYFSYTARHYFFPLRFALFPLAVYTSFPSLKFT
jgi:hypothetical protein